MIDLGWRWIMGKSYSGDLRDRIVGYVSEGGSRRGAAKRFGVSDSCAVKLLARVERTGSSAPARQGRPPGEGKLAAHRAFLIEQVEAKPDITLPQLASLLERQCGVVADPSSLSRALRAAGFTYKKSPDGVGARTRGGA
jgi:transposase